jgi:1-acyl-sn-glycerol-3-phosphate acyltransferase
MMRVSLSLRSGAFFLGFVVSTIIWALASLLTAPLPFRPRYAFITAWNDFNIWWLKVSCRIDCRIEGLERLPPGPCIVMSNHQSTWETLALKRFFPPMAWVLKRELLWVPFFGWGLALTEPIALNRGSGRRAVEELVRGARKRLSQGRWVIVFPEGTRVPPGETRRYKLGGAVVASQTGAPIVPVGHNSGTVWPRRSFLKRPGTVIVRVGQAIETRGRPPELINAEVKKAIEALREDLRSAPIVRGLMLPTASE